MSMFIYYTNKNPTRLFPQVGSVQQPGFHYQTARSEVGGGQGDRNAKPESRTPCSLLLHSALALT